MDTPSTGPVSTSGRQKQPKVFKNFRENSYFRQIFGENKHFRNGLPKYYVLKNLAQK
jgi:hypothetical protein